MNFQRILLSFIAVLIVFALSEVKAVDFLPVQLMEDPQSERTFKLAMVNFNTGEWEIVFDGSVKDFATTYGLSAIGQTKNIPVMPNSDTHWVIGPSGKTAGADTRTGLYQNGTGPQLTGSYSQPNGFEEAFNFFYTTVGGGPYYLGITGRSDTPEELNKTCSTCTANGS